MIIMGNRFADLYCSNCDLYYKVSFDINGHMLEPNHFICPRCNYEGCKLVKIDGNSVNNHQ